MPSYALSVIANDIFGIQRVEYLVDGVIVATASNPQSPIETFSTFDFANGPHTFSARVTNLLGNTTVVDNAVTIANGTVVVGLPVMIDPSNSCDFRVQITDGAGAGISAVTQDGVTVASNLPGTSTLQLSPTAVRNNECVPSTISATDNIGNSHALNFGILRVSAARVGLVSCSIKSGC